MFFCNLYFSLEKTAHENVNKGNFEIQPNGYKNKKFKRKLSEYNTLGIKNPL